MIAYIAPVPDGTASCIKRPRSSTSLTASLKSITPAQTSAEYSPNYVLQGWRLPEPNSCQTRQIATEAVKRAGWVRKV